MHIEFNIMDNKVKLKNTKSRVFLLDSDMLCADTYIYRCSFSSDIFHIDCYNSIGRVIFMDKYEQYRRVFDHFDSNGDGRICPSELQQCVESIGGHMTAEEAEVAVVVMGTDGGGLLCLEDFVKIIEGAGEEERANDMKEAFNMYVEAAGGCITPKSLKRMLSRLGERRSAEDCEKMIACFDLNHDGVLCFEEFKIMMSA